MVYDIQQYRRNYLPIMYNAAGQRRIRPQQEIQKPATKPVETKKYDNQVKNSRETRQKVEKNIDDIMDLLDKVKKEKPGTYKEGRFMSLPNPIKYDVY